jgi:hypothetical protein
MILHIYIFHEKDAGGEMESEVVPPWHADSPDVKQFSQVMYLPLLTLHAYSQLREATQRSFAGMTQQQPVFLVGWVPFI